MPTLCCLLESQFRYIDRNRLKVTGQKNVFQAICNWKKAEMVALILDGENFRTGKFLRHRGIIQ